MCNPRWFDKDPRLAWGLLRTPPALYRKIAPHAGFAVLRRFASRLPTAPSSTPPTSTATFSARASP
ncbi:MAG: hypothetical protein R3F14_10415 [Polyangiaceae bacterium]